MTGFSESNICPRSEDDSGGFDPPCGGPGVQSGSVRNENFPQNLDFGPAVAHGWFRFSMRMNLFIVTVLLVFRMNIVDKDIFQDWTITEESQVIGSQLSTRTEGGGIPQIPREGAGYPDVLCTLLCSEK